jgi:hypothetical protein
MDPARYKELISDEWENIIRDSNDVLSILASVGVDITMTRRGALEAAPGEPQPQQQHALISASPKPKVVGDTAKVVKALLAPEDLESTMANAAKKAKDFYAAMDDAHELPYLDGLVGYWDQDATVKQSLLAVVGNLNGDYNDNMGRQYSAVDGLRSFARTAPGYAQEISEAKGPQLQSTIASLRVAAETRMTYAQQAADDFHRASESLGHTMQQIKLNMEQIQQQIHDLDESIEELEEAEREIIQDMLANAIGIIFATGALLIALGVFGPVGAAIDAAAAAGVGLEVTKDMVNEAMDAMKLEEIVELIEAAKAARRSLESSYDALKTVQPLFESLSTHSRSVSHAAGDVVGRLQEVEASASGWDSVELSRDDVEAIQGSWDRVATACKEWTDEFFAQGMLPPVSPPLDTGKEAGAGNRMHDFVCNWPFKVKYETPNPLLSQNLG